MPRLSLWLFSLSIAYSCFSPALTSTAHAQRPPAGESAVGVLHSLTTGQTQLSAAVDTTAHPPLGLIQSLSRAVTPGRRAPQRASIQKVFGPDERELRDTEEFPWSAVCKIYTHFPKDPSTDWYMGSGTLVGAKHLLTAAHLIYKPERGGWADRIQVVPGQDGSYRPYGQANGDSVHTFAGWTRFGDFDWDMALVVLDKKIGEDTGWFGFGYFSRINGTTAHIAGYPGDLDDGERLYYANGRIEDSTEEQVLHRIDTAPGNSGSGIYLREEDERDPFAVDSWWGDTINGGCRISETKYRSLASWIEADTDQ